MYLVLQVTREDAPKSHERAGGVVLGQRRVPFKGLRMGALLGAGGCAQLLRNGVMFRECCLRLGDLNMGGLLDAAGAYPNV